MKEGQKVIHNGIERTIYSVYDKKNVSLCLLSENLEEYIDVEEDYLTPINELTIKTN